VDEQVKIRAATELVDFLAERKQIRKRELISLSQDLSPPRGNPEGRTCRAAVVLAYAHWEGFVKDAARAYVRLVSNKSRGLNSLSVNFQALVCRQELVAAQSATRKIQPHLSVTKRLIDNLEQGCSINADAAIDTESNLTAAVFENICLCVGLDFNTAWATDGPFIDDLFRSRCGVAHGDLYTPDARYAKETVNFTIKAIDRFARDIENSAVLELYLRCPGRPNKQNPGYALDAPLICSAVWTDKNDSQE